MVKDASTDDRVRIARRYLNVMFSAATGQGLWFYAWHLPSRATSFYNDVELASTKMVQASEKCDVYVGMGLTQNPPDKGRGTVDGTDAIAALWADIDIADPTAHKKANLPPDKSAAMQILRDVGIEPSFVVGSGYGLHAYWLLDQPWIFGGDSERTHAIRFSRRWASTIKAAAEARGMVVDPVFDLTRVLRPPGTINRKGGGTVPVTTNLGDQPVRYSLEHLESRMIADELAADVEKSTARVERVGHLVLSSTAEPPTTKLMKLVDGSPQFKDTWNYDRPDLGDTSFSSYDMALANLAVAAHWTDQEIASLIISFRRQHGGADDVAKGLRLDYLQRTIGKARAGREADLAVSDLVSDASGGPAPGGDPDQVQSAERERLLANVSKALGINIVKFIKHGEDDPQYSLSLAGGQYVLLGNAGSLMNMNTFASRVMAKTNFWIRRVKGDEWRKIINRMLSVVEVQANEESSPERTLHGWLQSYLPSQLTFRGEEWSGALPGNQPFIMDGRQYVSVNHFRRWLRVEQGENVDRNTLWEYLRVAGFRREDVQARHEGRVIRRSYWSISRGELDSTPIDEQGGSTARAAAGESDPPI
jgi:hypothetical protein